MGGRGWPLETVVESLSQLQTSKVGAQSGWIPHRISPMKNNKQFSSWFKSMVGLYLHKNNNFSLSTLIYVLGLKHQEVFFLLLHSYTFHAHSSPFSFPLFCLSKNLLHLLTGKHLPRPPNNIRERNTQVDISKVLVMPAAAAARAPLPTEASIKIK